MFGIGLPELVIILVIALIVVGPHKLPDLARSLGKGLGEFKKATDGFQQSIRMESLTNEEKKEKPQVAATPAAEPADATAVTPPKHDKAEANKNSVEHTDATKA